MERYDEHLSFHLPEGFEIIHDTDDSGNPTFAIGCGRSVNDKGETQYENRLNLNTGGLPDDESDGCLVHLSGDISNQLCFLCHNTSFMGMEFCISTAFLTLHGDSGDYHFSSVCAGKEDRQERWLEFLNQALSAIRLEGKPGNFEPVTMSMLHASADAVASADAPFPIATPGSDQHSHLDFQKNTAGALGFLGGMVQINANGTEYSFDQISLEDEDAQEDIENAVTAFPLAATAREMGEIFRLSEAAFNPNEDRESEIHSGLLRRARMFDAFRSFAWTLGAWCDQEGKSPADMDAATLADIAQFVTEDRNDLNYKADSFCSALCTGDDIHNFFVPDAIRPATRRLLEETADGGVYSLESLRRDLTWLQPAMERLYDSLADGRNFDEPLEEPAAEVLYVWCAMTFAARYAFYTEDGPMTCYWDHPGEMPVLKSFGTAPAPRQTQSLFDFTYTQGLQFKNEHYTFPLPDGFVFSQDHGDRDFIAYLPNPEDPDDQTISDFIIYAGNDLNGQANPQLKLVLTYHSVLDGFARQMPGAESWLYHRPQLPGIISVMSEPRCLHANAVVAYGETLKMFRFQIALKRKKDAAACEALIKGILDRVVPAQPVTLLDSILDEKYLNTPTLLTAKHFAQLLEEYASQIALSRNQFQQNLVSHLQSNNPGPAKVKKEIREMLGRYADYAAARLQEADIVWQLARIHCPDGSVVEKMEKAITEHLEALSEQMVRLDGEEMKYKAPYLDAWKRHKKAAPDKAIADILSNHAQDIPEDLLPRLRESQKNAALLKAKAEKEAARRKAEAAEQAAKEAARKAEAQKRESYEKALTKAESTRVADLESAIATFTSLGDYRDSAAQLPECREKLQAAKKEEDRRRRAAEARKAAEEAQQRAAEAQKAQEEKEKQRAAERKRNWILAGILIAISILIRGCILTLF